MTSWTLDELLDHDRFSLPFEIGDESPDVLTHFIHMMVRIRAAERKLAEGRRDGLIGGPECISAWGRRRLRPDFRNIPAARTGSSAATDRIRMSCRSALRSRAVCRSAWQADPACLMAWAARCISRIGTRALWIRANRRRNCPACRWRIACRKDGWRGRCRRDHLETELSRKAWFRKRSILPAPCRFLIIVVENNLFASHMHISLRQSQHATSRFAAANGIAHALVDGNDVVAVSQAAKRMFDAARSHNQPGFIEAVTYRWLGHVDWR